MPPAGRQVCHSDVTMKPDLIQTRKYTFKGLTLTVKSKAELPISHQKNGELVGPTK